MNKQQIVVDMVKEGTHTRQEIFEKANANHHDQWYNDYKKYQGRYPDPFLWEEYESKGMVEYQ